MNGPYSIRANGLSLWYEKVQALRDITLDIRHGLITALIGPSGCGKTTFLRCCNRLNERYGSVTTTGSLTILGQNVYEPDISLGELRRTVGMVFQRPNPLPISVYDNVAFGLRAHGQAPTRARLDEVVQSALTDVSLWNEVKDSLRRRATTLSLAQQQKLCIARLLPLKPEIVLMDEPCSALDAKGTDAIERLINDLRTKYTVVVVTHNMAQARRISDESVFMLLGAIIEHGRTADIFLRPAQKQTELYVEGRYG